MWLTNEVARKNDDAEGEEEETSKDLPDCSDIGSIGDVPHIRDENGANERGGGGNAADGIPFRGAQVRQKHNWPLKLVTRRPLSGACCLPLKTPGKPSTMIWDT